MPKPCKMRGCPKAATPGRASCAEHHGDQPWKDRRPWMERYGISGSRWQKVRAARIAAANNRCQRCHKRYKDAALQIDHIGDRKDHSVRNTKVLCKPCHDIRTKAQAAEGRRRYYDEGKPGKDAAA
jgi:5-methylcytosine-specific restriction endonuclease McrA